MDRARTNDRSVGPAFFRLPADGAAGRLHDLLRALLRSETYAPHRNPHFLFGLLLGLPIPASLLGVHLHALRLSFSWDHLAACFRDYPLHWWFLAHPFLFAAAFGALGTVARDGNRRILDLVERLRSDADTDFLTGLFNHRAFQERVREEASRADRESRPVALLWMDIDRFKEFNDRHGHPVGDRLLEALAERMLTILRPYDIVCRYGGEEFAAILPGTDGDLARRIAERLRAEVALRPFALPGAPEARSSLSIGVTVRRAGETVESWIDRADRRLYRAKATGRNCVCFRDEPEGMIRDSQSGEAGSVDS